MAPSVILWDIMDTVVRDPFFTHMPAFFGQSFQELVQRLQPGTWVEFELGRLNEPEFFARFFKDGSVIDGPALKRCMANGYAWIEGMPELLGELRSRSVPMHALSNYPEWYQLVEERLELSRYLSLSFISCRTGVRKPALEAFSYACESLGLPPESCLLVDDRAQNCEAARKVGLPTLHFDGDVMRLRRDLAEHRLL
jgi:FMN phosphatase YigB (HAD superfamily)